MKAYAHSPTAGLLGAALAAVLCGGGVPLLAHSSGSRDTFYEPQSAPASVPSSQAQPPAKAAASQKATAKKPARRRRPRAQTSPTPARIEEIQSALSRAGYYFAEPSGKWDAATQAALKRFQAGNELSVTGKLSARTLQKLGLGSQVSGLAPPRPAPSASRLSASPPN